MPAEAALASGRRTTAPSSGIAVPAAAALGAETRAMLPRSVASVANAHDRARPGRAPTTFTKRGEAMTAPERPIRAM